MYKRYFSGHCDDTTGIRVCHFGFQELSMKSPTRVEILATAVDWSLETLELRH